MQIEYSSILYKGVEQPQTLVSSEILDIEGQLYLPLSYVRLRKFVQYMVALEVPLNLTCGFLAALCVSDLF